MMIPGYELVRLAVQRLLKKHPFSPDNGHIHHLLSKKVQFLNCYLYIQFLIIFPFAFYYITSSSLISLLISSIIYISFIVLISKKEISFIIFVDVNIIPVPFNWFVRDLKIFIV